MKAMETSGIQEERAFLLVWWSAYHKVHAGVRTPWGFTYKGE